MMMATRFGTRRSGKRPAAPDLKVGNADINTNPFELSGRLCSVPSLSEHHWVWQSSLYRSANAVEVQVNGPSGSSVLCRCWLRADMEYKYESSCESGTDKMGTRYGPGGSARSINFNFVQGKGHLLRAQST